MPRIINYILLVNLFVFTDICKVKSRVDREGQADETDRGCDLLRRFGRRRCGCLRQFGADAIQAINDQAQITSAAFAFQDDWESVQCGLDGELGLLGGLLVGYWRYVAGLIGHKKRPLVRLFVN